VLWSDVSVFSTCFYCPGYFCNPRGKKRPYFVFVLSSRDLMTFLYSSEIVLWKISHNNDTSLNFVSNRSCLFHFWETFLTLAFSQFVWTLSPGRSAHAFRVRRGTALRTPCPLFKNDAWMIMNGFLGVAYISKTIRDIEKHRRHCRCKIQRPTNLIRNIFSISPSWDVSFCCITHVGRLSKIDRGRFCKYYLAIRKF